MRKSFTLLFSTLILLFVFGYTAFAAAPQLAATGALTPADDNVNVNPTTTNLVVKFNQNVRFTPGGGTLWIRKGNIVIKTIALETGNANATISGSTLTVKHGLTLATGEAYSIGIDGDAIENTSSEKFAGIVNTNVSQTAWNFVIGDYTKPVVESLVPADNATNVDVKAAPFELQITFNDVNDIVAVDGKKVWLYREDGTIVDIVIIDATNTSVSGKTAKVTISPYAFRDELTNYYINVEAGAFKDASPNGNTFAGIMNNTSWTITSRDYTAPFVMTSTVDDITSEGATLNVTISEPGTVWYKVQPDGDPAPVNPGDDPTGWTSVDGDENNAVSASFTGLDDGTDYIVYVVAANADGDVQPLASEIEFTTIDITAPLMTGYGQWSVDNKTIGIWIEFNEPVIAGAGDLVLRLVSNNQAERRIAADSSNVTIYGTWIEVVFDALASLEDYYVIVPDGYVTDLAGNPYDSDFSNTGDWILTSSDYIPPSVTGVTLVGATPPDENDNIEVEFSEEVYYFNDWWWYWPLSDFNGNDEEGWFPIIALEQDDEVIPFTANYSAGVITIDPSVPLLPNTTYTVKIRPDVIYDNYLNPFSSTHRLYTVTTSDFGPATIAYEPADGATDLEQGTQATITFSKNVRLINNTAITPANIKSSITFKEDDASGANVPFSVLWDDENNVITVVPDDELESEGTYYLSFNEAAVEDLNDVVYSDPGSTTFTLRDYVPPMVTFSHSGIVDDMDDTDPLTLTFSEAVTIDGNIEDYVIFRQDGPNGAILGFSVVMVGEEVTITPSDPLEVDMVYYYGIGENVASDVAGNTNSAAFSTFTFVPAIQPAGLLVAADGFDPEVDALNVDMSDDDFVATITFAEAAKAAPGLPAGTVATLYDSSDNEIATADIEADNFEGSVLTLTFDISAATITSEGEYYIVVPADVAVANANNNKAFAGVAAGEWTFTAADVIAPVLSISAPLNGATGVALNAPVVISFVETNDLVAATGNITIEAANDEDDIVVAVANVTINNTANTITIPHAAFTQYNTVYTVTVPAGAFADEAGNQSNAISTWSFTTSANPAPAVVELDPFDEEDMLPAGTDNFIITFSEEVQKGAAGTTAFLFEVGTGASRAALAGNGTAVANDDIQRGAILVDNASDVAIDGTEVTLDFNYALEAGKEYFILLEDGMFVDKSEPVNAAFVNNIDVYGGWNFYTKDVTAPLWEVSYDVVNGGMDINSNIVLTFNKPVDFNDAAINDLQITDIVNVTINGAVLTFTGTINEDKTVITLDNDKFVPELTVANSEAEVVVTLDAGFKGVNNNLPVTHTVAPFYIADFEAPVVTLAQSAITGESLTATIQANDEGTLYWIYQAGEKSDDVTAENVMAGTSITGYTSGTRNITITGLDSETTYTVYGVGVDENNNVSDVAWVEITTADITDPVVLSKSNVFAPNGVLTLTFSEDVLANGATAIIREAGTLELVEVVTLAAGAETNELTLTSATAWAYDDEQQFVIEVEGDVVSDVPSPDANYWAGQTGLGENAWIVGLPDRTKPVLLSVEPHFYAPVDEKVALNAVFKFTFSENIKLAQNYQFGIYQIVGAVSEPFEALDASRLSISGNILTIDPSRTFQPATRYELWFTSGDIEDMAGNEFLWQKPDLTTVTYYSDRFTTVDPVDNVAPTATFSPANGATNVSTSMNQFIISLSEPIVLRNGTAIDEFDMDTVVYVRMGTEDIEFDAYYDEGDDKIYINLPDWLELGAQYTYGFEAVFMDAAGNNLPAASATFTVETAEVIDTHITFVPDDGFPADPTVVPVDQEFRIIFDGELYTYSTVASENNIAVTPSYLEDSDVIELKTFGGVIVPFSASIERRDQDTTIILITPDADLLSETGYWLTVKEDVLQLGVGNVRVLTYSDANDYFTMDALPPVAVIFTPADNGTANRETTMAIKFNDDVMAGTGSILIKHEHGEIVKTIDAATLEVDDVDETLIYITDLSSLQLGQEYFVIVPAGAITDTDGNAWAGVTVEDAWNFTMTDVPAAPVVVSVAPLGSNAPVNTTLVITFDRPVVLSEDMGFIALYDADGIALELVRVNDDSADRITFNADNTQAYVTIGELEDNSQYHAEVAEGTFVLEGFPELGNAAVTRSFWVFTTEINAVPVLQQLTPADNSVNVRMRTVAKMVFDIEVQAGSGTIDLRRGDDASIVHQFDVNSSEVVFNGKEVSFDLEGIIQGNATDYYIIVPEGTITNISQDPESFPGLEQTYEWNFTTGDDFVLPELVIWTPNQVELPAIHPVFEMHFSEDVVLATPGNLVVTKVGSTQPALVIPLSESMITDSIIRVTYDEATFGTLEYESQYFVTIGADIIEDMSENPWGGVSDPTAWVFNTKDRNVTIAEIQGTGSASPMVNVYVRVTGTVTGISIGEGFFMQDANAPWSGLWVEYPNAGSLAIGDGVVVIGDVAEISEVTSVIAESVADTDAPLVVAPIVLASPGAAKAEMYENVLVQVLDGTATASDANFNWSIAHGAGNNVGVTGFLYRYTSIAGHVYDVTGIVNGRLGNYRLAPRMASDIIHYQPIADIQGTGNISPKVGEDVYVQATVTAISTGEGFYMQDASAAWSGIWVEYANAASLSIGNGVKVFGDVAEISEVTSIVATSVTGIEAPAAITAVVVTSPSAAKAEMYESVLVQVEGARANAANTAGTWSVYYMPSDNVNISSRFYAYSPVEGNFYDVTGVVNGRMSNYRMDPRMAEDITDITVETGIPNVSAVAFKVYPNPFNDNINIDNHDKLSRVIVTNIAGQRVLDVQYPGRTISTANLVSGVYVISLFNEDGMVKSDRIVKR